MESAEKEYLYCIVSFPELTRRIAYLTDDETIQPGDEVYVPFESDHHPKKGRVERVLHCTLEEAPIPPEWARRILSRAQDGAPPPPMPAPAPPRKKRGCLVPFLCLVLLAALCAGLLYLYRGLWQPLLTDVPLPAFLSAVTAETAADLPLDDDARARAYSGQPPAEGMPMSALQYTTLGAPDVEEKCPDYELRTPDSRYIRVSWYSGGAMIAQGVCRMEEGDAEMLLYSFRFCDSAEEVPEESPAPTEPAGETPAQEPETTEPPAESQTQEDSPAPAEPTDETQAEAQDAPLEAG